jgi:fluoroquinolone resistance protein
LTPATSLDFLFRLTVANSTILRFTRQKSKRQFSKIRSYKKLTLQKVDLTSAVFDNCNLTQAVFDHTILEKADFRTSYNYSIDPEINRIKKAKFSILGVLGLLDKYDIDIEK